MSVRPEALEPLSLRWEQLSRGKRISWKKRCRRCGRRRGIAQFREQIGAIECEARKRAADLESETVSRLERITEDFRRRYQELMTIFDATATHVTGELRKVEVNLTQLPRAMDQAGKRAGGIGCGIGTVKTAGLICGRFREAEPPVFPILWYEACGSGYNSKCTSLKNRKFFITKNFFYFCEKDGFP